MPWSTTGVNLKGPKGDAAPTGPSQRLLASGTVSLPNTTRVTVLTWTVTQAGRYWAGGVVAFSASANGSRLAEIQKNGSPFAGSSSWVNGNSTGASRVPTPSVLVDVAVGDTISLVAYHNANTTLTTESAQSGLFIAYQGT